MTKKMDEMMISLHSCPRSSKNGQGGAKTTQAKDLDKRIT
jgi:hypothetical protein